MRDNEAERAYNLWVRGRRWRAGGQKCAGGRGGEVPGCGSSLGRALSSDSSANTRRIRWRIVSVGTVRCVGNGGADGVGECEKGCRPWPWATWRRAASRVGFNMRRAWYNLVADLENHRGITGSHTFSEVQNFSEK